MQNRLNGSRCLSGCGLGLGQGNVLDSGPYCPMQRSNFGGKDMSRHAARHCLELCKNGRTDLGAIWVVDLYGPSEACVTCGAHWRHMANTIEPFVCCGDAPFFYLL